MKPGHFQACASLDRDDWIRGVIQIGGHAFPFGPVSLSLDAEWEMNSSGLREIENIAEWSGGKERVDLADIWREQQKPVYRDMRVFLLVVFTALFLLDALLTRLDISLGFWVKRLRLSC